MNGPNVWTWQQVLALHELAGKVPASAAPTPKGGICSQSKNIFCHHCLSSASRSWVSVALAPQVLCKSWSSVVGKVACTSLLTEGGCNAAPAWTPVTVWGLPALRSVFLLTPSNLECDKSKPGLGLAAWPSTVNSFRLLQTGVRFQLSQDTCCFVWMGCLGKGNANLDFIASSRLAFKGESKFIPARQEF